MDVDQAGMGASDAAAASSAEQNAAASTPEVTMTDVPSTGLEPQAATAAAHG